MTSIFYYNDAQKNARVKLYTQLYVYSYVIHYVSNFMLPACKLNMDDVNPTTQKIERECKGMQ
jgi:hypothetical protein